MTLDRTLNANLGFALSGAGLNINNTNGNGALVSGNGGTTSSSIAASAGASPVTGAGTLTVASLNLLAINASGVTDITAKFNNQGSVSIASGTVRFVNDGIDTGSYAATGALVFGGGTRTMTGGGISGTGAVTFNGAVVTMTGTYTPTGATTISTALNPASSVTFNQVGGVNITNLLMQGGVINGTANLTVPTLNWTGGSINTTGAGTLSTTSTATVGGAVNLGRNWTMNSNSTISAVGAVTIADNKTLTIAGSQTLTLVANPAATTPFVGSGSAATGIVQVSGTAILDELRTGDVTMSTVKLNNSGTVNNLAGNLFIGGSSITTNGIYATGAGSIISVAAGTQTLSFGSITGTGTLEADGGNWSLDNVAFPATLRMKVKNGTMTVNDTGLGGNAVDTLEVQSPGTFTGTTNLTAKNFQWDGGTLAGSGTLTSTNNAALGGTSPLILQRNYLAGGGFILTNTSGLSIANANTLTSNGASTLNTSIAAPITGIGTGAFTNNSTLTSTSTDATISSVFNNNAAGTVNVTTGKLTIANSGTDGGNYTVAGGTTLGFSAGTRAFASGGITGTGDVVFSGTNGTTFNGGAYNLTGTGTTTVAGGNVAFNINPTTGTYTQTGGVVSGVAAGKTLNVSSAFNWTGGTFNNTNLALAVAGASTVNLGANSIALNNAANTFAGAVSLNNTGANNVSLNSASALNLAASNVGSGTLTITASGSISQSGAIVQAGSGAASFSVTGLNNIALNNAGNNFQGTTTLTSTQGDAQINDVDALTAVFNVGAASPATSKVQAGGALVVSGSAPGLKTITTGGAGSTTSFGATTILGGVASLDVTSTGAISQTGVITTPNLLLATPNVDATLNTSTNAITNLGTTALGSGALKLLDAGGLTVTSAVGATGGITLNTSGALAVNAPLNAGAGTVSLTTTGGGNAISQSVAGVITAGTLAVTTTNANAVLTTATNFVSNLGPVTQGLGGMDLKNAVNITFTGAVNNAGFLLNNTGTATINSPVNVGTGTLTLNSTGGITQGGAGDILAKTLVLSTTNANVTLNVDPNNAVSNLGPASLGTGALALVTNIPLTIAGAVNATGGIDLQSNGAMAISNALAAGGGNVSLSTTGGGAITQAAPITGKNLDVSATGAAITLNNVANDFTGTVRFTNAGPNNVTISDANSIQLGGGTSSIGSGTLTITAGASGAGGAITQAAGTDITQAAGGQAFFSSVGASGPITLNQNNNFGGSVVTLSNTGNNNVTLTDINPGGLVIGASGIGTGTLSVNAIGTITQSGAITQQAAAGAVSFNAGTSNITLTKNNDFTGAVSLTGGIVQIIDANNGLTLGTLNTTGALTANSTGAGPLNLGQGTVGGNLIANNASNAITQTGALTVAGTANINAVIGNITLNNANNDFQNTVTLTGSNIALTDKNALTAILNATGVSTLTAGGNLIASGNAAGGLTTITTGTGTTTFGATNVTGGSVLNATSAGAIVQSGTLTLTGTSSFNAGANDITLADVNNDFASTVTLTGANVQMTDKNALTLGALAITGNLTARSNGVLNLGQGTIGGNLSGDNGGIAASAITQTGALTVTGTTLISAGANLITLNQANNDFAGAVSLTGTATQITDKNALTLGTLNTANLQADSNGALNLGQGLITGTLNAASNNNPITQTGALIVTGAATVSAGTSTISLPNTGNDFQGVTTFTGSNVQLTDSSALTFALVGGTIYDLTSGGNLAVSGNAAQLTTKTTGTGTTDFGTTPSNASGLIS